MRSFVNTIFKYCQQKN